MMAMNDQKYQNGCIQLEDDKLVFQIFNKQVVYNMNEVVVKVESELIRVMDKDNIMKVKLDQDL